MKKIGICGGSSRMGARLIAEIRKIDPKTWIAVYDLKYPPGPINERPGDEYNIFDLTNTSDYYAYFHWQKFAAIFQIASPPEESTELQRIVQTLKMTMSVLEAAKDCGHVAIFQPNGTSNLAQIVDDLAKAYGKHVMTWAPYYGESLDQLIVHMAKTALDVTHTIA